MNRRTYIYIWSLVVLSSVLLVSSCHERQEVILPVDGDGITLIVNEGAPYATKAAGEETIYSSRVNGDESQRGVYLQVIEDVIRTELQDSEAELTKGTPYSGNNIGSFHIDAFTTTNGSSYVPFLSEDLTSSDGTIVGTGHYWPLTTPETKISFFGYSKSQSTGTLAVNRANYTFGEDASHSGTFTYTLPDATTDNSTHPDIVFAIAPNQSKPADGQIEVDFYHALSAITFSVGEIPTNFIVNSITFTNIHSSGSCSYTYAQDGIIYYWKDLSSKKDYTQTFDKEMFGQGANPSPSGSAVNTASQTFMMIPQTIDDDARITIDITIKDEHNQGSRQYSFTKNLKDITPKWEAGKKYTFQISSPNEVEIVVSDEVNRNVKSNLVIKNNGLLPVYVRVAIIGYWINSSDEQIVADWDPEVDGDFNWGTSSNQEWGTSGEYWRKGSDGFYYCMKLLNTGEEISKKSSTHKALFDTYTLTATPPKAGSELEMIISVQALRQDQISSIWPNDISTAAISLNL